MSLEVSKIAEELAERYAPEHVDYTGVAQAKSLLTKSIMPSDIFAFGGQGAEIQTSIGKVLDMSSMTVNAVLGQNDPWVTANMIAFLKSGRPSFLSSRYGSEFYYLLAEKLAKVGKIPEAVVNHRQCNGSDVTELALLAAYQRRAGRTKLASFEGSYHGQNLTSYLASDLQKKHRFLSGDGDETDVLFLPAPDNQGIDGLAEVSDSDLRVFDMLEDRRKEIFAVILEPIQVNNGVRTPSKLFMQNLQTFCNTNDIALIFDEIQTGFGWLGELSAAERYDVVPDMLAVSKGLTGGYGPMSALVMRKSYENLPYGTAEKTNGSDLRALVAANSVWQRLCGMPELDIPDCIDGELRNQLKTGLISQVTSRAEKLDLDLKEIMRDSNGLVSGISGDRMLKGLNIVDPKGRPNPDIAKQMYLDLLKRNVYVRCSGSTLIVKPPLVITDSQLNEGLAVLMSTVKEFGDK